MSDAIELANTAGEYVEDLIADVLEGRNNSRMLLGTVESGRQEIQIQLVVTKNHNEFLDEQ